ncbi:MAG: hypothetical protein QM496_03535 [Verrucomicrobiota bacterium]
MEEMENLALKYKLKLLTYRNSIFLFTPEQFKSRQKNYAEELEQSKHWQASITEATTTTEEDGFFMKEAFLNDVIQYAAKSAQLNYFHNSELSSAQYTVTGYFFQSEAPIQNLEALALAYGLKVIIIRDTIYVFTLSQYSLREDLIKTQLEQSKHWQASKNSTATAKKDEGFFIRDAQINDVIQFLAKSAQLNYFHNPELSSTKYYVTGHLSDDTSFVRNIEALALAYGLKMIIIRDTVYVFTLSQYALREDLIKTQLKQSKHWQPSKNSTATTKEDDGFFITKANLNEVAQFIAVSENLSYQQNPELNARRYQVTGHLLSTTPPLHKIEGFALIHNLRVKRIKDRIHIFTAQQFASRERDAKKQNQ